MTMLWRTRRTPVFTLLSALAAIGLASTHEGITSITSVIDGDTIEIHGQRIRLYGIDAPESSQLCAFVLHDGMGLVAKRLAHIALWKELKLPDGPNC
jgi:endonuclease YncB( thermonuclease family)